MSAQPKPSWFDQVRASAPNVLDVADGLGMGVRSRRFGPCPACGKDDRRHPPLTPRHGGNGWMCAHCKETGDAVKLAAWVVAGSPKPGPDGWVLVRNALAARGWCEAGGSTGSWSPPERAAEVALPFPDERELWGLLRACRPLRDVPEVQAWCRGRRFVDHLPAAVLPDVYRWPAWWPFRGRPWRLVVSMVDHTGTVRSLHARATEDTDRGKTRWPFERRATGLLFADPVVGRPMLRGKAAPRRVVVAEGITDYLAACRHAGGDTAVLGATSGGFLSLGLAAIPKSAVVYAWTDPDATGDRYAAEIARALPSFDVKRVDLRRRRP